VRGSLPLLLHRLFPLSGLFSARERRLSSLCPALTGKGGEEVAGAGSRVSVCGCSSRQENAGSGGGWLQAGGSRCGQPWGEGGGGLQGVHS